MMGLATAFTLVTLALLYGNLAGDYRGVQWLSWLQIVGNAVLAAAMWALIAGLVLGPIACASSRASRPRCGAPAPGSSKKSSPLTDSEDELSSPAVETLDCAERCGATSGPSASTPGSRLRPAAFPLQWPTASTA